MRTHGHRERNINPQGLLLGVDRARGGIAGGGGWRGIALGEIPNVDDGVMDTANHYHGTCIPM